MALCVVTETVRGSGASSQAHRAKPVMRAACGERRHSIQRACKHFASVTGVLGMQPQMYSRQLLLLLLPH